MEKLLVIKPRPSYGVNSRMERVLQFALKGIDYDVIESVMQLDTTNVKGRRLLFAVSLGISGINTGLYEILEYVRMNTDVLEGCTGGVLLDGKSELYTKSVGRDIVFTANLAGCRFPGRCLVEATGSLKNYNIQAKNQNMSNELAYMTATRTLVLNIIDYKSVKKEHPKILAVHASDQKTSNTLAVWNLIKEEITECEITEISLRNGHVMDCRGCSYEICSHFSNAGSCYYGGTISEEAYPAILACDAIVMLCPNYNDAISGNLTAFVNRLTSLFVRHRFYDKSLFGVIVSGYSGSDIVAEQLISGLNMNKTFALPGRFAMMETANDPRAVLTSSGIGERAHEFAENIRRNIVDTGIIER